MQLLRQKRERRRHVPEESSHALRACDYRDPALVAEQRELRRLGCEACETHTTMLGKVVCADERVTNTKRVPHIGSQCKYFKLEERS